MNISDSEVGNDNVALESSDLSLVPQPYRFICFLMLLLAIVVQYYKKGIVLCAFIQ